MVGWWFIPWFRVGTDGRESPPSRKIAGILIAGSLGGGNSKIFGIFTPKIGEDEPILTSFFCKGVETTN